jgi:hypothetical protein
MGVNQGHQKGVEVALKQGAVWLGGKWDHDMAQLY